MFATEFSATGSTLTNQHSEAHIHCSPQWLPVDNGVRRTNNVHCVVAGTNSRGITRLRHIQNPLQLPYECGPLIGELTSQFEPCNSKQQTAVQPKAACLHMLNYWPKKNIIFSTNREQRVYWHPAGMGPYSNNHVCFNLLIAHVVQLKFTNILPISHLYLSYRKSIVSLSYYE